MELVAADNILQKKLYFAIFMPENMDLNFLRTGIDDRKLNIDFEGLWGFQ